MTGAEQSSNVLLEELKWVHSLVRRDLQTCRTLAVDVAKGAAPDQIQAQLEMLQTRGPLFQLRTNCLHYCRFVHSHHSAEDILLFPAVRRFAPTLNASVDKLESDHRQVSLLLDTVEYEARQLAGSDPLPSAVTPARQLLVEALDKLSGCLSEHLAYEEETLAPVLSAWDNWPFFD